MSPAKRRSLTSSAPRASICGKADEGIVEVDQVVGRRVVVDEAVEIERLAAPAAAALEPLAVTGAIEQDPPHRLGRGGEEVAATVPRLTRIRPDETQVGLVNQRRRLERLTWILVRQSPRGQASQLVVNQRQQVTGSLLFASDDGIQDSSYFVVIGLDRRHPYLTVAERRAHCRRCDAWSWPYRHEGRDRPG